MMNFIWILLNPSFWMLQSPVSVGWDKRLNELMDANAEVVITSQFEATIGGIRIWIENYPYAFATPRGSLDVMPKRRTIKRLKEYIVYKGIKQPQ